MKKKKIIVLIISIIIIIISILFLVFNKNTAKVFKNGNTKSSQEIVDYILNISSYDVNVTVEVNSNKNKNKYTLNQKFVSPNITVQEVIEPSNISGIKITNDGTNLKIENSNLSLTSIFENYNYLGDNNLDLITFINEYRKNNVTEVVEEENQIVMNLEVKNNIYVKTKSLYIDKKTYKPTKLEVKDNNEKITVYILYNEVEINSTKKEDVIAFEIYNMSSNV